MQPPVPQSLQPGEPLTTKVTGATPPASNQNLAEEGQVAKRLRQPSEPTAIERANHELTHVPYREWCGACVKGRGPTQGHRAQEHAGHPVIQLDYYFPLGNDTLKGLSAVDRTTGYGTSTLVRYKGGTDKYAVRQYEL